MQTPVDPSDWWGLCIQKNLKLWFSWLTMSDHTHFPCIHSCIQQIFTEYLLCDRHLGFQPNTPRLTEGEMALTILNAIWVPKATATYMRSRDFPDGAVERNPPVNAEDVGPPPGPGRWRTLRSNQAHVPQTADCVPRAPAPWQEATAVRSPHTSMKPSSQRDHAQQWRPSTAKNRSVSIRAHSQWMADTGPDPRHGPPDLAQLGV